MKTRYVLALVGVVALAVTPLQAHHGWSSYDQTKTLTLKGVIKEMSYANPHGSIRLQENGNGKTWTSVLAPPSRMTTRGLTEEMLTTRTPEAHAAVRIASFPSVT